MKSHVLSLLFSSALLVAAPAFAQEGPSPQAAAARAAGKLVPVTEKDADWAEKARKAYPLDACLTSDEKLGSMGKSPEYIYRVDGKPDRLVVFCCDGCEEDFMKDPAKYLAKVDAAAKAKASSSKPAAGAKAQGAHQHE